MERTGLYINFIIIMVVVVIIIISSSGSNGGIEKIKSGCNGSVIDLIGY